MHKKKKKTQKSRQGIGGGISLFIYISVIAVVSVAAAFFTQVMQNGDIAFTAAWAAGNLSVFIINAIVMATIFAAIAALTGDLFIGLSIFGLLTFLCSYVSYFKARSIGEPLFPWDLIGLRELYSSVVGVLEAKHFIPLIACVAFCTAAAFIGKIIRLKKFTLINRACIFIVSLLMIFAVCFYTLPGVPGILESMGADTDMENENLRYQQNGFILSFLMNIQDVYIGIPENYKEDRIVRMADQINLLAKSTDITEPPEELPNIVMVLNGAFWDPSKLVNFKYSEDPLKKFHELEDEGYVKNTVTPQLGGKTCNAEYELLTGLSEAYLPQGSIPYLQYIASPIPCLPDYLKAFGYKTIAVCAYEADFWNRDEIYANMKFDVYISAEDFAEGDYELRGGRPTDAAMTEMIIKQYESAGGAVFIFAITAEDDNYAKQVYNDVAGRSGADESGGESADTDKADIITVKGTTYDKHNSALSVYLQRLCEADKQLEQLTDYFAKCERDTKLVFTGDHLPVFDGYSGMFADGGMIRSPFSYRWSTEELLQMHTVPIVMWGNAADKEEQIPADNGDDQPSDDTGGTQDGADAGSSGDTDDDTGSAGEKKPDAADITAKYMYSGDTVSMWLIPTVILDWCKIPMNPWFKQIWRRGEVIPVYINGVAVDSQGNIYDSVTEEMQATYATYEMMNYDILFGKRYSKKYLYTKPVQKEQPTEKQ